MKKIILFILMFLPEFIAAQQEVQLQYEYAKDLFRKEKYFDAVTEFKRLVFFDSSGRYTGEAEYYIGLSYKKGGFYSEAVTHLNSAALRSQDSGLVYRARIEIIKTNILRHTFNRALQLISDLQKSAKDSVKLRELNLLKGFTSVFSDNWEEAENYFRDAGYGYLAEVAENNLSEKYSETKAKILSAFIPGAGQFYTGEYLNGIVSLAWNALSVYLTVDAFRADRIFDGVVTANFLWYRFYAGNIYNAGKFAREKNQLINTKYLQILQNYAEYRLD